MNKEGYYSGKNFNKELVPPALPLNYGSKKEESDEEKVLKEISNS